MEISHILRGPEWLSSVHMHMLLYNAFGWKPPIYYHLPMVLGEDGKKLSKRHGAQTVQDFKDSGYLPEAFINHIALLGWSFDDSRELFTLEEMVQLFSADKINSAPAVFDYKKLLWFNGIYIRDKTEGELLKLIEPKLIGAGILPQKPSKEEKALLLRAIPLIKERLKLLNDAPELLAYLFQEPMGYEPADLIPKKMDADKALAALEVLLPFLEDFAKKDDEENEADLRDLAARLEIKLGGLLMPLRVALTGSRVSPPLFDSIRLLGVQKTKARASRAIDMLKRSISA
jgi:glutamyl-tRNA synthetase